MMMEKLLLELLSRPPFFIAYYERVSVLVFEQCKVFIITSQGCQTQNKENLKNKFL